MRHGSLFSGGGGFDLAAERIGWENVFHCEWNPFCKTVLNYYWPYAESYKDIRNFDASKFRGEIDIITGGFPCQPFSTAGKRRGTADDRYLWPEMLRVISEVRPRWVVGENVQGIVNWNEGMVFDQVHLDLEAQGYEVQAFLLPAAGVNAPHRRNRVWFVAHAPHHGACTQERNGNGGRQAPGERHGQHIHPQSVRQGSQGPATDPAGQRCGFQAEVRQVEGQRFGLPSPRDHWSDWPTQHPLCSGNDGISSRLDGVAFPKWRTESVKVFGNAIVHQVALNIFSTINEIEGGRKAP